jgi:2-polyprenyl-6-methoxyphenol hydroxylase-like FAD-dependent oxidoreductase
VRRIGAIGGEYDYDVVIVGASLAGCAAAIFFGRQGARVALVDKQPDPRAFKRICTHFIQGPTIPTIERLGLLEPMLAAGAVRSHLRSWTAWGWIDPPAESASRGVNLRREQLDPIVREAAAATPGVELALGRSAQALLREGSAVCGVVTRNTAGEETELRGRLVVGADGRGSQIAALAGIGVKTLPNNRFIYAAHYEGVRPAGAPDGAIWILDPSWAAVFPTDGDLVLLAAMPTKERLPEFRHDPEAALLSFMAELPEGPSLREARRVGPLVGKLELENRVRKKPTAPGLALVGDAALATDPLFGVGCGWAFRSAEWLADSVAAAMRGEEALGRGLTRYRRRRASELRGHAMVIHTNSLARRLKAPERMVVAAATRNPKVATAVDKVVTGSGKPVRTFGPAIPRAIAASARQALSRRHSGGGASRRSLT